MVDDCEQTIELTAGIRTELRNHFFGAHYGTLSSSTMAFVPTVHEIEHHQVASSEIFTEEFFDQHHQEGMTQASITIEEVTDAYMVEVVAKCHFDTPQVISCRFSACLLRWEGREFGYSWICPRCAWP